MCVRASVHIRIYMPVLAHFVMHVFSMRALASTAAHVVMFHHTIEVYLNLYFTGSDLRFPLC